MSYYGELSFAAGYYTIRSSGDLVLFPDIPEDLEKKVRALWPDMRRRILDQQERGYYSSRNPVINPKGEGKIIKLDK